MVDWYQINPFYAFYSPIFSIRGQPPFDKEHAMQRQSNNRHLEIQLLIQDATCDDSNGQHIPQQVILFDDEKRQID